MADKTTTQETLASPIQDTNLIRGVQSGASVKMTFALIKTWCLSFLGGLIVSNLWTNRQTYEYTPTYDLASGGLSTNFFFDSASFTVPAAKNLNEIRFSVPAGGERVIIGGANSVYAPIYVGVNSHATSDPSSNVYGSVYSVTNAGAGTTKALHLLASGIAGSTGVLIAANMQMSPVATSGYTSGGFASLTSTGVNNKAIGYGIESTGDSYKIGIGNNVNQLNIGTSYLYLWPTIGSTGDYATLQDPDGVHKRFYVDYTGTVHIGWAGQTYAGAIQLAGATAQVTTLQAQATAGNSAVLMPTASGTLVSTADFPLSINATTGKVSCSPIAQLRFVVTGVNFNSANIDTAIAITLPPGTTRYAVANVRISNASASLTTSTAGVFTGAGGTGVAICTTGAVTVSASATDTNNNMQAMTVNNVSSEAYNDATIYFRVVTPQGSAATADVILVIVPLS